MFDIAAMGFLIGQGIGRWGNFINQEAYGAFTGSDLRGIQSDTKTSAMAYTTYVDENGKNWICDEIDFARGVRIKRINITTIGALTWKYSGTYKTFHALPDDLNRKCGYWVMCEGYTLVFSPDAYKDAHDRNAASYK